MIMVKVYEIVSKMLFFKYCEIVRCVNFKTILKCMQTFLFINFFFDFLKNIPYKLDLDHLDDLEMIRRGILLRTSI